ncbi:MAG: acetyl-CoA acetyltransferase [Acidimicrobiia bacterium]|jgi:acetyl-CoA C-acetyltransferase
MVFVLGGAQTDFAKNWGREDALADMLAEVVSAALADAHVDAEDIDVSHVGNFVGELFTGQGHLGAMMGSIEPALAGKPSSRHEAACASGSMALLAAMAEIEAGRYDIALVSGVEQMKNVGGQEAAEHLGAAMFVGKESLEATFPWPHQFSQIADEYDRRYGLDHSHLGAIARKNFDNATRNPLAQTRNWVFEDAAFGPDDELNPVIEGRLRKQDCGRITDGAAAIVVASERAARAWAERTGTDLSQVARIEGWGHTTASLLLEDKLAASHESGYLFPHMRSAIEDARKRAGITLDDIDVIETHDCFSISEYVAYDHLGITDPGEAWKAVESGLTEWTGDLPVNPSGGLIGNGHPVGSTGARMVLDAGRQVTGGAGEYQVPGAKTAQTLNIGGSCTTVASFVVRAGD